MLFIVERPDQLLTPTASAAIVTVVIGDEYQNVWRKVARPSWEAYAHRHGMDLIAVCMPLDTSAFAQGRSAAWQKCLILSQPWSKLYDRIVWLDADIVINVNAPNILLSCPDPTKVSAVGLSDHLSMAEKHILKERVNSVTIPPTSAEPEWDLFQTHMYRVHGVETDLTDMISTGVMVLSQQHHRDLLEQVYRVDRPGDRAYEQPALSHQIITRDLLNRISARFNWGIYETNFLCRDGRWDHPPQENLAFIQNELDKAYFLHFYMLFNVMAKLVVQPAGPA